jgi:hypothetical protein
MTHDTKIRTGQQRIEDALADILAEQRRMRERLELVMLAAGLMTPNYAPSAPVEPDAEEVAA